MPEGCFRPDWFSKPGDTLATLMIRLKLNSNAMAQKLECDVATVRGLLTGAARIDKPMAIRLSNCIGGSPSFWLMRQSKYEEALNRASESVSKREARDWLRKFPLAKLTANGWIDRPVSAPDIVKAYLAFFDVTKPKEWELRYTDFRSSVAFRTSKSFASNVGALSAWLRRGEIEAQFVLCAPWDPKLLRRCINDLRKLTKAKAPAYFAPRLREICAGCGVAVVHVRAPSGCRASGAARFVSSDRAMILLSFRYLSDDHFWFTLFHEIGHLLLHGNETTFVDGDAVATSKREIEANDFAASALLPWDCHDELHRLRYRTESIIRFALSVGVSPGVVVGQLQHQGLIKRSQFNYLKRRYEWSELASAFS